MKQRTSTDNLFVKHAFLDKFAGKLNSITKHGQITNDKGFRLPLINSFYQKRSSTMLVRQKKDSNSFSSQGRRQINLRAQKYLIHDKDNALKDVSNSFLKNQYKHSHTMKKHTLIQPLSATSVSHQPISQREQIRLQNINGVNGHKQNSRYSQYETFLSQLEGVKKVVRRKMLVI